MDKRPIISIVVAMDRNRLIGSDGTTVGSVSSDGLTVEAEFRFDQDGRLIDFHAGRYRSVDDGFELRPWSTPVSEHEYFDGMEVPAAGRALWHLDGETLEYIRLGIFDLRYT